MDASGQAGNAGKVQAALLDGLKTALLGSHEERLYRGGKLPGLFSSRFGATGEAARQALRDGLLEVVRSEVKGKLTINWVRITPEGVDSLHRHESPRAVL